MCVVQVANNKDYYQDMVDYARGFVARGIFYKTADGIGSQKEACNDMDMEVPTNIEWLVSHCRQPTQGTPYNPNNNHPWEIDGQARFVVGCQVGFTHYVDAAQYAGLLTGECDSELAFAVIAHEPDPWAWIHENVIGQLFFWAGESAQSGQLYMWNPALSVLDDGFYTTPGIYGQKLGLVRAEFSGSSLTYEPVKDTCHK